MNDAKGSKAERIMAVVIALCVWQIAAMTVKSDILLVSPVQVAVRLCTIWRTSGFAASIWNSFYHIAGGALAAVAIAAVLAALSVRSRWVGILLRPFMITVKTVPVASFVVICLIWLSSESLSALISFLIVLPVVYGNLLEGLKSEDVKMLQLGVVYKMPAGRRLLYIHLPQLKPFIMSGVSTALGMAWKAGIAAEIIGTPDGTIGKQLYYSKVCLDTDDLLCWTVIIVAISVLFEKLCMLGLRLMYKRLERG